MNKRIGILEEGVRKEVLLNILIGYKSAFDSLGELTPISADTRLYTPNPIFLPSTSLDPRKFDEQYVRTLAFIANMMSFELGGRRFERNGNNSNGKNGTLDALMYAANMLKNINEAKQPGKRPGYLSNPDDLRLVGIVSLLEKGYSRLIGVENTERRCRQNMATGGYELDSQDVRIIQTLQEQNKGKLRLLPSVLIDTRIVELEGYPDFKAPFILENLLDDAGPRLTPERIYRTLGLEESLRLVVGGSVIGGPENQTSFNWASPNFIQLYLLRETEKGHRRYPIAKALAKSLIHVNGSFVCGAFDLCGIPHHEPFRVGKSSIRKVRSVYFDTIAPMIEGVIDEEIKAGMEKRAALVRCGWGTVQIDELLEGLKQEQEELWTRGARSARLKVNGYNSLMTTARSGKLPGINDTGQLWDSFGLAPFKRFNYPTTTEGWKDFYYSRIIPAFIRRTLSPIRKDVPEPLRIVLGYSANQLDTEVTPENVIKDYRVYILEKTGFDVTKAPKRRAVADAGFGGFLRNLCPKSARNNPGLKEMGAYSYNKYLVSMGLPINFRHQPREFTGKGIKYYLDVYHTKILPRMRENGIPPFCNPGTEWLRENNFGYFPHDLTEGKLSAFGIYGMGDFLRFIGQSPFLNIVPGKLDYVRLPLFMGLAEIPLSIKFDELTTHVTLLGNGQGRLKFPLRTGNTQVDFYVGSRKLEASVPKKRSLLNGLGYPGNKILVVYSGPRVDMDVEGVVSYHFDGLVSEIEKTNNIPEGGIQGLRDVGNQILNFDSSHPPSAYSLASRIAEMRRELVKPSPRFLELDYTSPAVEGPLAVNP